MDKAKEIEKREDVDVERIHQSCLLGNQCPLGSQNLLQNDEVDVEEKRLLGPVWKKWTMKEVTRKEKEDGEDMEVEVVGNR